MNIAKTLVCGRKLVLSSGTQCIELSIPAWKDEKVLFPVSAIPGSVLKMAGRFPDNQLRFYANVDLDAQKPEELKLANFQTLDLVRIFS